MAPSARGIRRTAARPRCGAQVRVAKSHLRRCPGAASLGSNLTAGGVCVATWMDGRTTATPRFAAVLHMPGAAPAVQRRARRSAFRILVVRLSAVEGWLLLRKECRIPHARGGTADVYLLRREDVFGSRAAYLVAQGREVFEPHVQVAPVHQNRTPLFVVVRGRASPYPNEASHPRVSGYSRTKVQVCPHGSHRGCR